MTCSSPSLSSDSPVTALRSVANVSKLLRRIKRHRDANHRNNQMKNNYVKAENNKYYLILQIRDLATFASS